MNKMGNEGFTLIEVLAVIVIVSLLSIIVVPNVMSTIGVGKSSSEKIMIDNIKTASEQLYEELEFLGVDSTLKDSDGSVLKIVDGSINFHLQALVNNGFLVGNGIKRDKVLVNPKTGEKIGDCIATITKASNGKFSFSTSGTGCPNLS